MPNGALVLHQPCVSVCIRCKCINDTTHVTIIAMHTIPHHMRVWWQGSFRGVHWGLLAQHWKHYHGLQSPSTSTAISAPGSEGAPQTPWAGATGGPLDGSAFVGFGATGAHMQLPHLTPKTPHGKAMLDQQLRQLNLQLSLMCTRTLSKNIKDQASSIQNPTFQLSLEIAFLAGREVVIKDN